MIEESLLKSNLLGRDGFVWWIGRVAHPDYWKAINTVMDQSGEKGQRCKVRIIGYHPFDSTLKEEDLPWADVLMDPISGSGQGGIGQTLSLQGGETCVGFFMDGEEAQQPVIFGLLHRNEKVENSFSNAELKLEKSSRFQPFTGNRANKPTNAKKLETQPVAPGKQGKVKPPPSGSTKTEASVCLARGAGSPAQDGVEKKTTKTEIIPSNCGDDAIGKLTQILTDFIAFTNMLDFAAGAFVDPLLNKIVDMPAKIDKIVSATQSVVKSVMNNVRDGLLGKLTVTFSTWLGTLNLKNPASYLTDPAAQKGFMKTLATIYCIFEKLIQDIVGFLTNLFQTMIGNIINGPVCAAEQFVSSIFAKIFDLLEKALEPIMSGLEWLMGGFGQVRDVLRQVSSVASAIYSFIGCDGLKCTTPSKWVSSANAALKTAATDWQKQLDQIDVFDNIANDINQFGQTVEKDIANFFGTDENNEIPEYNGMRVDSILSTVDSLTGGDSSGALNKGLGSIESAIATSTLFGEENSVFNACNQKINNPTSQSDIIPMPLGYTYYKCIPPEIGLLGNGDGAVLRPVVSKFGTILSVLVVDGGSGYDRDTSVAVIDNTGHGTGARVELIIKDGSIEKVAVLNPGLGYCSGSTAGSVDENARATVEDIYIEAPGIGFDSENDTVSIGDVQFPLLTTPNGSIINIQVPNTFNVEFDDYPEITINTNTGTGASLIPIMSYKPLSNQDNLKPDTRRTLVGITSVIDCI